ncbi:MAG TPA: hypothetical protein VK886_19365 [Vicinamibacterales bacterium]|nr:hypothetical protein [Vicinamibacterales bacterium]
MSNDRDNVGGNRSSTSRLVDSVDAMVRLPLEMTGATWDLMVRGMQSMTGGMQSRTGQRNWDQSRSGSTVQRTTVRANGDRTSSSSGSSWTSGSTGQDDQDLSGDDLKYVIWSIAFTKPGFECVLQPQHEEIVNYDADGASFAALKIAKFLERARHGRVDKPEAWGDMYPPVVSRTSGRRTERTTVVTSPEGTTVDTNAGTTSASSSERGWRIPAEDQKYITFLYRVDRRLPKETEVTRVERVTVERGTSTKIV